MHKYGWMMVIMLILSYNPEQIIGKSFSLHVVKDFLAATTKEQPYMEKYSCSIRLDFHGR